jgi:hypothetical protein
MSSRPEREFDPAATAQLACPFCLGNLSFNTAELVCVACRRAYPIVDGIPVLIAERAETSAQGKAPAKVE